jgi:hypothetical protein
MKIISRTILLYILALSLIFVGCSIIGKHDKVFDPYVDHFTKITGKSISAKLFNITLVDLYSKNRPLLGVCIPFVATIQIDRGLIYHELSHCACMQFEHIVGYRSRNFCPIHYMNDSMPHKYCVNKYWNDYIKQLKQICN